MVVDDAVYGSTGDEEELSSQDSPLPQVEYFHLSMAVCLAVEVHIELLHDFGLSLCDNVDVVILPPFLDDGSIPPEALVLEMRYELLELVLLPLDLQFRVAVEEDLGEDSVLEPHCLHPVEGVGWAYGEEGDDGFAVEDQFVPLGLGREHVPVVEEGEEAALLVLDVPPPTPPLPTLHLHAPTLQVQYPLPLQHLPYLTPQLTTRHRLEAEGVYFGVAVPFNIEELLDRRRVIVCELGAHILLEGLAAHPIPC